MYYKRKRVSVITLSSRNKCEGLHFFYFLQPTFSKEKKQNKIKQKWFNISLALNVKCLPPTVVQSAAECTIVPENIRKLTGQITRHCVDLLLRFVTHIAKSTQLNLNKISWFR